MIRLLIAALCAVGLAGCVVAPPYAYGPAPAYGYAPSYYAAPSISVGVGGGYYGGRGRW